MPTQGSWPDAALRRQASRIGGGVLHLAADESRWVHRRVESLTLPDARSLHRSVSVDLTIPAALADDLTLAAVVDDAGSPADDTPRRLVLPLALIPKEPLLLGLLAEGNDAVLLTRTQGHRLLIPAFAPDVHRAGVDAAKALTLVAKVLGDGPAVAKRAHDDLGALLEPALAGDSQAKKAAAVRLKARTAVLVSQTFLLVAVDADPGVPITLTYAYEQTLPKEMGLTFGKAPLRVDIELGSSPRVRHVLEVQAPESFEVESAAIYRAGGDGLVVRAWSPGAGDGRIVRLMVPSREPGPFGLVAYLGFAPLGLPLVAVAAALLSLLALLLAAGLSELLGGRLGSSGSGTLLALPALLSSAVLGATSTRVTSRAVTELRAAGLLVAVLGLLGGVAIGVGSYEGPERKSADGSTAKTYPALTERSTALWLLASGAIIVTAAGPGRAAWRARIVKREGDAP